MFVVGIYWGLEKPSDPNEYLKPFVGEAVDICQNGVLWRKKPMKVHFFALICDVPAKSMALYTKGHSCYRSCSKCSIRGKYLYKRKGEEKNEGGRVCFPGVKQHSLRKDEEFARVEIARFLLGSTLGPGRGSLAWPWVVFLNGTSSSQAREVAKKFLKFMAGGV